ncbi:MAG: response regulator [Elusimicrobiota bacterium]
MFHKKTVIIIGIILFTLTAPALTQDREPEVFNDGVVNYVRGNLDEAVVKFEQAYNQAPDNEKVKTFYLKSLVEMGTRFYEQDQYDKAKPYLEKAYNLAPDQKQVKEMYEIVTDTEEKEEDKKATRMTPILEGFRKEQEKLITGYLQQDEVIEDVLNKFEQERKTLEKQMAQSTRTNTYIIVAIVIIGGLVFVSTMMLVRKKDKKRMDSLRNHEEKIIRELREVSTMQKSPRINIKPEGKGSSISKTLKQSEKKILVVDDSKDAREGMTSFLNSEDFNVDQAENGEKGIELLKKNKYNIVVTDLKMEEVGGIQVLKKAKEIQPDIEVIVVTAYGSAESAVDAMKHGAYDYILKPLNMDQLEIIIERCLERQKLTGKVSGLQLELLEKELAGENDPRVAMNLLEPFLDDKNEWIQANAARILYRFNEKKALSVLRKMLQKPAERFHRAASWAAKELDCEAALNLTGEKKESGSSHSPDKVDSKLVINDNREVVTDIDPSYRRKANEVEAMEKELTGDEDPRDIYNMLSVYLNDANNRIRANAVKILYPYDREKAMKEIRRMLDSKDKWMKISALWVCSQINNKETVKILKEQSKNSDKFVSKKAGQFLNQIGKN